MKQYNFDRLPEKWAVRYAEELSHPKAKDFQHICQTDFNFNSDNFTFHTPTIIYGLNGKYGVDTTAKHIGVDNILSMSDFFNLITPAETSIEVGDYLVCNDEFCLKNDKCQVNMISKDKAKVEILGVGAVGVYHSKDAFIISHKDIEKYFTIVKAGIGDSDSSKDESIEWIPKEGQMVLSSVNGVDWIETPEIYIGYDHQSEYYVTSVNGYYNGRKLVKQYITPVFTSEEQAFLDRIKNRTDINFNYTVERK